MALDKYVDVSGRVQIDDLDWDAAREAGLTERERFILGYFADIESQTVMYMRDLLMTRTAMEPEVSGFLSMWNYEEFFHGRSLSAVLEACGHPQDESRSANVRAGANFRETFELFGSATVSRALGDIFPPTMFTWGAMQENLTTQGYDAIVASTSNPVLKVLAARIAKQERRHFAFYQNLAKERLAQSAGARRLARTVIATLWAPVGSGVKTDAEVRQLMEELFQSRTQQVAAEVDRRLQQLPGMDGLAPMTHWYGRVPRWKSFFTARKIARTNATSSMSAARSRAAAVAADDAKADSEAAA